MSDSLRPHALYSPWNSPGQNIGMGSPSLLQGIFPTQRLQADSLPAAPQGKPKNTGVCSLCLLQRIFLIQESNWGLLHCRQILYQLSQLSGKPSLDGKGILTHVHDSDLPQGLLSQGNVCATEGLQVTFPAFWDNFQPVFNMLQLI